MSVNNQTVSKQKLHAFFDALKQYGIEMQWGVEPAGDYYNENKNVGIFIYKDHEYSVDTYWDGDTRSGSYLVLRVKQDKYSIVESLNFDKQTEAFQEELFQKLGITSNPGQETMAVVSAEDFVDKCFQYFKTETEEKYIQSYTTKNNKMFTGPKMLYKFQLIQTSKPIIDENLVLLYTVQYRRNQLGASFYGKFQDLTGLKLITKKDNLRFDDYTLETVDPTGMTSIVLYFGKAPTTLEQWKYAFNTHLGMILQTIVNKKYSQTLTSGCPACSEHQKCPVCEQWDALERLVAAVELHMDNP